MAKNVLNNRKMPTNFFTAIVSLNVNGLNPSSPIRKEKVAEYIRKQKFNFVLLIRETFEFTF